MNEEIWFVENQFPWFVMDDDSHGFWFVRIPDDDVKVCYNFHLCRFCHKNYDHTVVNCCGKEMCVYLYTEDNLFQAVKKCKEQWEKFPLMKEEEDKDWLRCNACAMKTKSHWYHTTTNCNCPGNADIDDCKCEEVEEGIFCGYCGEYHKGVSYIRNGRFI